MTPSDISDYTQAATAVIGISVTVIGAVVAGVWRLSKLLNDLSVAVKLLQHSIDGLGTAVNRRIDAIEHRIDRLEDRVK